MATSKIEWTDRSDWNCIRGCTRVSPGCGGPGPHGGCYAEAIAARFSDPGMAFHGYAERTSKGPRWTGKVELQEDRLTLPLKWKRPAKVFASSTSDVFHEALSDEDIARMFAVMAMTPHLTYQVLTKRADRMRRWFDEMTPISPPLHGSDEYPKARGWTEQWANLLALQNNLDIPWRRREPGHGRSLGFHADVPWPLPNVWLGVSVEDQERAEERIPELLAVPAAVRWLSCEPLLGPLDLRNLQRGNGIALDALTGFHSASLMGVIAPDPSAVLARIPILPRSLPGIEWIVVGGESGPRARDNDFLANARGILAQCREAFVPFFGKQGYRKALLPEDLRVREFPTEKAA